MRSGRGPRRIEQRGGTALVGSPHHRPAPFELCLGREQRRTGLFVRGERRFKMRLGDIEIAQGGCQHSQKCAPTGLVTVVFANVCVYGVSSSYSRPA